MFGTVHGRNVALLVDSSDACLGFGRRTSYVQALTVSKMQTCVVHAIVENLKKYSLRREENILFATKLASGMSLLDEL